MDKANTQGARGSRVGYYAKKVWPFAKHLIVPLLCLLGLYVGLVIGYVKLGGQPASDIWKLATWKHLIDLVFG